MVAVDKNTYNTYHTAGRSNSPAPKGVLFLCRIEHGTYIIGRCSVPVVANRYTQQQQRPEAGVIAWGRVAVTPKNSNRVTLCMQVLFFTQEEITRHLRPNRSDGVQSLGSDTSGTRSPSLPPQPPSTTNVYTHVAVHGLKSRRGYNNVCIIH